MYLCKENLPRDRRVVGHAAPVGGTLLLGHLCQQVFNTFEQCEQVCNVVARHRHPVVYLRDEF